MRRSIDVTAAAIVLLLFGLVLLVAVGEMPRLLLRLNPEDHARVWRGVALPMLRGIIISAGAILTAYGIFKLRRWARISVLSMSAGMVGFGAYLVIGSYLTLPNHGRVAYTAMTDSPLFIIWCMALGLIVPGSWWILLFTCDRVTNQFDNQRKLSRTTPENEGPR